MGRPSGGSPTRQASIPFLIPTPQPNPSGITQFGRLVHWLALGLAALLLIAAYMTWAAPVVQPTLANPYPNWSLPPGAIMFSATITALIGQAARYLFAGE